MGLTVEINGWVMCLLMHDLIQWSEADYIKQNVG